MKNPLSSPISRRRALRQTIFYSAAAALGGRRASAQTEGVSESDHHFLMLGDFGSLGQRPEYTLDPLFVPTSPATPVPFEEPGAALGKKLKWVPQQASVAEAMQTYVQTHSLQPEGMFLLGDNFYGSFKGGVNSPRWKTGFEDMYPANVFPGPCWAMLGNHDYDEESGLKLAAELEYADAHPGTRWTMPAKWYRVDWPAKDPILTVLVLDSNYKNGYLYLTTEERTKQLKWMQTELAKPRVAPWLVCMGHHPLYTNGVHGDNAKLIRDWSPLFQQFEVPFYFCGHDHDLQHLEFEGLKTSFVISGGGGAHRTQIVKPNRGAFSQSVNGFTHLQVSREKFIVRHLGVDAKQLYAFSRTPDGRVASLT